MEGRSAVSLGQGSTTLPPRVGVRCLATEIGRHVGLEALDRKRGVTNPLRTERPYRETNGH